MFAVGQRIVGSAAGELKIESGDPSVLQSQRVAVVSSWASRPQMSLSLSKYLTGLADNGYAVLLVSTAEFPGALEWPYGLPAGTLVARRQNLGYDFGSWAAALAAYPQIRSAQHVLLTNDSLVGPFAPITDLLRAAEAPSRDVWFMTSSLTPVPHGQSFFVMFNEGALSRQAMVAFFDGVEDEANKETVIEKYELPLGRTCAEMGLDVGVLFPASKIGAGLINPTLSAWRKLLFGGAPFLKRTVLLDPLFRTDSILMQKTIARNFAEDVRDWLPAASREQLPVALSSPPNVHEGPVVRALRVDGRGELSNSEPASVPYVNVGCGSGASNAIEALRDALASGAESVLIGGRAATLLPDAQVVSLLEQSWASVGKRQRLLVAKSREVSRKLKDYRVPPWAEGVVQDAPLSLLWPEPPISYATLEEGSRQVDYRRMRLGAMAQLRANRDRIIPGVLVPGANGPDLLGLELVRYSEAEMKEWIEAAAAYATKAFPDNPEVFVFDFAGRAADTTTSGTFLEGTENL